MSMRYVIIILALNVLWACGGTSSGPTYDLKGFQTESVGGGATFARYADQANYPLSSGHVINGVRNGAWTTYHPESAKPKTITNYINGVKNGDEIQFNERGYITSITGYKNDVLHGLSGTYKNGRTVNETTYADGQMNGPFRIYDENNGKIQRSGNMKGGKQHGELLYYKPDGTISMRYEYNNGEKVSGGIVTE